MIFSKDFLPRIYGIVAVDSQIKTEIYITYNYQWKSKQYFKRYFKILK